MEAVHFTTIPCEPNTASWHIQGNNFAKICPFTYTNACARFEVLELFRAFLILGFSNAKSLITNTTRNVGIQ